MKHRHFVIVSLALALFGCQAATRVNNSPGSPSVYEDPGSPGVVSGVGIESQDIIGMADEMARDILAEPEIMNRTVPARIVLDSEYFTRDVRLLADPSFNKALITDSLRVELNRAARGRIEFLARHYGDMIENERGLEMGGAVSGGTQGPTGQALGYDYRLGGRIGERVAYSAMGTASVYHQITFELVERGSSRIVWGNTYRLKKTAQDHIAYR